MKGWFSFFENVDKIEEIKNPKVLFPIYYQNYREYRIKGYHSVLVDGHKISLINLKTGKIEIEDNEANPIKQNGFELIQTIYFEKHKDEMLKCPFAVLKEVANNHVTGDLKERFQQEIIEEKLKQLKEVQEK